MRGCAPSLVPPLHTKMGVSQVFEKMTVKVRRIVWSRIMYDPLLLLFEKWFHEL